MTDVNVLDTPKQNIKLFIRNRLLQVILDLENASSSIDRNLQDSVAFRLEQIAFICSELTTYDQNSPSGCSLKSYRRPQCF